MMLPGKKKRQNVKGMDDTLRLRGRGEGGVCLPY